MRLAEHLPVGDGRVGGGYQQVVEVLVEDLADASATDENAKLGIGAWVNAVARVEWTSGFHLDDNWTGCCDHIDRYIGTFWCVQVGRPLAAREVHGVGGWLAEGVGELSSKGHPNAGLATSSRCWKCCKHKADRDA
jgi:hypothetical protein